MQANQIARMQQASLQRLATSSFSFTQKSRDLTGSTFADLFAQMRADNGNFGYSANASWNDSQWQTTNQYADTQNSSQAVQQEDAGRNDSRNVSSEEGGQESFKTEYGEDNYTVRADEGTEAASHDEPAIAENQDISSGASEHDAKADSANPALLTAFAEAISKWTDSSNTGSKGSLDESAKKELTAIIKEMGGNLSKQETADILGKLKEWMQKYPDAGEALKGHLQKAAMGQDKGTSLSALREMMDQMNLRPQSIDLKKTRAGAEGENGDAKSKANFSLLESAASEHSKRRIKTDLADGEQKGINKDAKQATGSGEASRLANQADRAAGFMTQDNGGRWQRSQEGGLFRQTLADAGDRMNPGVAARQNAMAKGAEKAAGASANQETVIKNFQDVKALLDKQILQVKETSVSSMTVKLNPEELGQIKIQLEMLANGKLQGKIFVENEVTKNSLLQHAEAMKEQIKAQGVSLEGFEIDMGSDHAEQKFSGFDQQGQFGRQPEKSRQGQGDFSYDEEMSGQLKSALKESVQMAGTLNTLA